MWQIMWMLSFLPDWFWSATLIVGLIGIVAGWILKFIPFFKKYKSILKVLGVILVVISVWFLGGTANEEKWQAKVKDLEEKIKLAEEKSKEENEKIVEKVVEKTKVIKGKTEYITQYLDREVVKKEEIVKFVENCPLPKDIIDVHNQAASMGEKK